MSEPQRPTQIEYWNSKVGEEWARQADRTDTMFAGLTQATFKALDLKAGERVLDIGCGAGATTLTAAQHVGPTGHAVGVDISKPLLELASARANGIANIDFIGADAGVTDIPGAPFDAAFSRFGVMFFENPVAAFTRIRANLRPGGRIALICWRGFLENKWTSGPVGALTPMLPAPLPLPDETLPGPMFFADPSKPKSVLGSAGWQDITVEPWDGDLLIGATAEDAAAYLLKIGPSARAIADHKLDPIKAEQLIVENLAKSQGPEGVSLAAACWIVRATA
jgi:SAM-dependent methyltransferase